ncbi:MAG TPA: molybdenum cofactor guanylyltransferase [Terracidiphilus sp.]|jgi:molybdopterin-guanine dinucleotide biosynthesis protein A
MLVTEDENAAGFILAGGQSSRMGQDKALLSFAGRPLIASALSVLRQAGLPATIAGGHSQLASFAPVIRDAAPGLGPLSGICAALASNSARYSVFLPVDLPLLPASLLRFLVHHAQVTGRPITLSAVNGFAHTFPAVLDRAALPVLEAELAAGRRGCFAAFHAAADALRQPLSPIPVEFLVQSGQADHPRALPAARWFLNVNTPADFERASKQVPLPIA